MKIQIIALLISSITTQVFANDNSRVITLKNSCSKDGWIIVTDGYGSEHPNLPTYRLNSNSSIDFTWPAPYGSDIVWSGNFGICLNGTCEESSTSCDDGGCFVTANGPMTRAEFTISTNSDFYDISIINGINVPMSITPYGDLFVNDEDAYWCGNPGAKVPLNSKAASSLWDIQPPSPYYTWVISGGASCESDDDCSASNNEVCGLSNNIGQDPQFYLSCGQPNLGYWTADQVCGADREFGYPFNCSEPMTQGPSANTNMWTYLGCTDAISSCYQTDAPSSCCGCFDWWTVDNIPVPESPLTKACVNVNQEWQQTAGTFLKFLKSACPSCYTYPYDDMSSTFICNSDLDAGVNTADYVVEFCPQ